MLTSGRIHGPVDHLEPDVLEAVTRLVDRLGPTIRHAPLGDATWRELAHGSDAFNAAWAEGGDEGVIIAYAQTTQVPADEQWVAEVVVDPDHAARLADLGAPLLRRTLAATAGHTHYWISDPTPAHHELVARVGLRPHRMLHQMRRALPLEEPWELEVRPFVPGQDEDALLEVNRRSFANHPDQGRMTRAQLAERMAQAWFDPAGCLLAEIDGRLAGFCWTKVFTDLDPPLGEIHIIGIDPDFAGRALGRRLVLAGLDHLASRGIGEAVLFVEGDNQTALAMYQGLGFRIVRTDHAFATG